MRPGLAPQRVGIASACIASLLLLALLPVVARAFLPDNRIFEQVTPPNKNGNTLALTLESGMGLAERNGDGVLFQATGAMGIAGNGMLGPFAAKRTPGVGWTTEAAESQQAGKQVEFFGGALFDMPDEEFNKFVFYGIGGSGGFSPEQPEGPQGSVNLYLEDKGPLSPPVWLGKPTVEHAIPEPGYVTDPHQALPVGGTPKFENLYFTYDGTLVPEDAGRAPYVTELETGSTRGALPWGFYEWTPGGGLISAGELPNGKINPFGAVPASFAGYDPFDRIGDFQAGTSDNQVSEDGTKAFFVSPDPTVPGLSKEPAELFVRELLPDGSHKVVLVSRDPLLKDVKEENKNGIEEEFPASAPDGIVGFENPAGSNGVGRSTDPTDAYGAPDGSHVLFASTDALTSAVISGSEWELYLGYPYSGGHFKISVTANSIKQTTPPIAWEATTQQVQAALEGLSNVGAGGVTVSEGPAGAPHQYLFKFPKLQASLELDTSEMIGNAGSSIHEITAPYMYEFDLENETLTYLPNVTAPIAAVSHDMSRILFEYEGRELRLWTDGPEGGTVNTVTQLPPPAGSAPPFYGQILLQPSRSSANGSSFIFETTSALLGFKNANPNGETFDEIYRLDVPALQQKAQIEAELKEGKLSEAEVEALEAELATLKDISCVSCPPPGVDPSGSAEFDRNDHGGYNDSPATTMESRGISADGSRIFFDTPDPLVSQDTNGQQDVYEWENGNIYLLSSGTSTKPSTYIDSSESGNDVFLATDAGLVPADKDRQADVYDARIPRPGDNPAPAAVPCTGDVCQGPPSVPQLLSPAASAVFNGLGNIPPEAKTEEAVKPTPAVECKHGYVKQHRKCVRKRKAPKKKRKSGKRARKSKGSGK